MKKDISFIKNQKTNKYIIDYETCSINFYYHFMRFVIDFDGWLLIEGEVHNSNVFNDVSDNFYIDLFSLPKQYDKITKQNEIAIKYIYKRFFGA